MISTYRELMNYIDNVTDINNKVYEDLQKVNMDLSGNIQYRVDIQMNIFIKDNVLESTINFQNSLGKDSNVDNFQLGLINLKDKFQLLYNISKLPFISTEKRNELRTYIKKGAVDYQNSLIKKMNTIDSLINVIRNVNLGSLVD